MVRTRPSSGSPIHAIRPPSWGASSPPCSGSIPTMDRAQGSTTPSAACRWPSATRRPARRSPPWTARSTRAQPPGRGRQPCMRRRGPARSCGSTAISLLGTLLTRQGKLSAVIDFGSLGMGDPGTARFAFLTSRNRWSWRSYCSPFVILRCGDARPAPTGNWSKSGARRPAARNGVTDRAGRGMRLTLFGSPYAGLCWLLHRRWHVLAIAPVGPAGGCAVCVQVVPGRGGAVALPRGCRPPYLPMERVARALACSSPRAARTASARSVGQPALRVGAVVGVARRHWGAASS